MKFGKCLFLGPAQEDMTLLLFLGMETTGLGGRYWIRGVVL